MLSQDKKRFEQLKKRQKALLKTFHKREDEFNCLPLRYVDNRMYKFLVNPLTREHLQKPKTLLHRINIDTDVAELYGHVITNIFTQVPKLTALYYGVIGLVSAKDEGNKARELIDDFKYKLPNDWDVNAWYFFVIFMYTIYLKMRQLEKQYTVTNPSEDKVINQYNKEFCNYGCMNFTQSMKQHQHKNTNQCLDEINKCKKISVKMLKLGNAMEDNGDALRS